jgi:hypothetical protein
MPAMLTKSVIKHFGGPAATAKALGITIQAVNDWPDEVPPLRQLHVEKVTSGKFKAAADVFERISKRHKGRQ